MQATLSNGRRAVLRLNDRGPFVDGRIIDLSKGAADALGMLQSGVGEVRAEIAAAEAAIPACASSLSWMRTGCCQTVRRSARLIWPGCRVRVWVMV